MEVHKMHRAFQHGHLGEEKQQMLSLNRRLETYLNRVKMLEEENALLAKEIQATRCNRGRDSARRRGLEEELRRARLEVDAAWRDRVTMELEVGRLAEELQALDSHRQREAQAQVQAKAKLEKSRKELEEEQRAQIWLKEKVSQLEMEMGLLVQTHQDDVAHLESTLTHSRAIAAPPAMPQRGKPSLDLLQLGEEYTQRASRACQQTEEAYQGKLEHLEETLEQTRRRLMQAEQEKSSSLLQLRALEKEIASAQDVRLHLEKTAMLARDRHGKDIHTLQEHLESLEEEREELGRHIDNVVMENRALLQLKMSLGLEVATYRALLDGESYYRGDVSLCQQRNVLNTDVFFGPTGLVQNNRGQLSAANKTTSISFACGATERSQTATLSSASTLRRRPVIFTETLKRGVDDATKLSTTPYPKILQEGAIESFRPQEVQETVTYAEPLSPPNELEILNENLAGDKDEKQDWTNTDQVAEPVAHYQVHADLSSQRPFNEEISCNRIMQNLEQYPRMAEELCGSSDETDRAESFNVSQDWELKQPSDSVHAWAEKECLAEEMEPMQGETSDSETEALLEPTLESRTSSPASECEPTESVFNQVSAVSHDDGVFKEDTAEMSQEVISLKVGTEKKENEEKLYPDGEEMDTWDSVMERKVDLRGDEGFRKDEAKQQYAEPEEDISMRKPEHSTMVSTQVDRSPNDKQENDNEEVPRLNEEDENDDEEEDSQNVSVSWRTELESDSYAQDNTLADTRPLIRYKSDETEANTQASHMDESESSEGESERKAGETGTWGESKSKKFGTMEDLCEEVEEEALGEGFEVGYSHQEERLDEETRVKPTDEVYDEELDIDRLVEQELENLSTDSYSVHFAKRQPGESEAAALGQDQDSDAAPCTRADTFGSSTPVHPDESLCFDTLHGEMLQTDTMVDEEPTDEDQESFREFVKTPQMEELNSSQTYARNEESVQYVFTEGMEAKPLASPNVSREEVVEDTVGSQACPDVPETAEWEVLENPREDFEVHRHIGVLENPGEEFEVHRHIGVLENPSEDLEVHSHADVFDHDKQPGAIVEGAMTHVEETPGFSPEETNIFTVKDSSELSGSGLLGLRSDFWVSSLETGATFQPDDEAPEEDQNLGFSSSLAWTDSGNATMVNGNSRVDVDSSDAQVPKADKEQKITDVFDRNAAERVHSEDSEAEGPSWSSEEE